MTALLVVCGALAREAIALKERHDWDADIQALPAELHNRPSKIPSAVRRKVEAARGEHDPIVVVYGDCGTGGRLQALLAERGWIGLAAPHCYSLYAGHQDFEALMNDEPGTFFLTDYLVRSFDHLVVEGLGLDRHPVLQQDYFGNYKRVVYLQQQVDERLLEDARRAADTLGLPLEVRHTGLTGMERQLLRLLGDSRKTEDGSDHAGEADTSSQVESHTTG